PRLTISNQLQGNRIENQELLGRRSLQPSHLEFKERLAQDVADITLFVYGLAYFKNENWTRAIDILKYVESPKGFVFRGLAFHEKSFSEIDPLPDLKSAIDCYEHLFPSG